MGFFSRKKKAVKAEAATPSPISASADKPSRPATAAATTDGPREKFLYTPRYAERDALSCMPSGSNPEDIEAVKAATRLRMSRSVSDFSMMTPGHKLSRNSSALSALEMAYSSRPTSMHMHPSMQMPRDFGNYQGMPFVMSGGPPVPTIPAHYATPTQSPGPATPTTNVSPDRTMQNTPVLGNVSQSRVMNGHGSMPIDMSASHDTTSAFVAKPFASKGASAGNPSSPLGKHESSTPHDSALGTPIQSSAASQQSSHEDDPDAISIAPKYSRHGKQMQTAVPMHPMQSPVARQVYAQQPTHGEEYRPEQRSNADNPYPQLLPASQYALESKAGAAASRAGSLSSRPDTQDTHNYAQDQRAEMYQPHPMTQNAKSLTADHQGSPMLSHSGFATAPGTPVQDPRAMSNVPGSPALSVLGQGMVQPGSPYMDPRALNGYSAGQGFDQRDMPQHMGPGSPYMGMHAAHMHNPHMYHEQSQHVYNDPRAYTHDPRSLQQDAYFSHLHDPRSYGNPAQSGHGSPFNGSQGFPPQFQSQYNTPRYMGQDPRMSQWSPAGPDMYDPRLHGQQEHQHQSSVSSAPQMPEQQQKLQETQPSRIEEPAQEQQSQVKEVPALELKAKKSRRSFFRRSSAAIAA